MCFTPPPSPTWYSGSVSNHLLENVQDDNTFNASPELPSRTSLCFLKNRSASFEQGMEHLVLKYNTTKVSYKKLLLKKCGISKVTSKVEFINSTFPHRYSLLLLWVDLVKHHYYYNFVLDRPGFKS